MCYFINEDKAAELPGKAGTRPLERKKRLKTLAFRHLYNVVKQAPPTRPQK